jgi:hypothetical protein
LPLWDRSFLVQGRHQSWAGRATHPPQQRANGDDGDLTSHTDEQPVDDVEAEEDDGEEYVLDPDAEESMLAEEQMQQEEQAELDAEDRAWDLRHPPPVVATPRMRSYLSSMHAALESGHLSHVFALLARAKADLQLGQMHVEMFNAAIEACAKLKQPEASGKKTQHTPLHCKMAVDTCCPTATHFAPCPLLLMFCSILCIAFQCTGYFRCHFCSQPASRFLHVHCAHRRAAGVS